MRHRSIPFSLFSIVALCSCTPTGVGSSVSEETNTTNKNKTMLVCFSSDKEDDYFGKTIYDSLKRIDKEQDNPIAMSYLELGGNGSTYVDRLKYEIDKQDYDYITIVGNKSARNLKDFVRKNQGYEYILIDTGDSLNFDRAARYDFTPEEIGYLAGCLSFKANRSNGYLSSYQTPFDDRVLDGYLQAKEKLSSTSNCAYQYLEEYYNEDKARDYTKTLVGDFHVETLLEDTNENLSAVIQGMENTSSKVLHIGTDILASLTDAEKEHVSNIIVKDYDGMLQKAVDDINQGRYQRSTSQEFGIKDGLISLSKEDAILNNLRSGTDLTSLKIKESYEAQENRRSTQAVPTSSAYTPKYSVDIPYHEAIPCCGEQNDWKYAPRFGADNGQKPPRWNCVCVWSTIYAQEGFDRAENVGIEFKNMRLYGYSESQGWKLIEWANPVGAFYDQDFTNDYHQSFSSNQYNDRNTKTTKIKLDNSNIGFNYHPFSSQNDLTEAGLTDLKYVITTMDIHLVGWDTTKTVDYDKAKYVANIGGDWWSEKGATWQPDWSTNRDICVGQFRTITRDWKTMYMSNIPVDQYDKIVGDGSFLVNEESL